MSVLKQEIKDHYQLERTIIGQSQPMQKIYKTLGKIAPSDITVLIYGESGTGKELLAQTVHDYSFAGSNDAPFVPISI